MPSDKRDIGIGDVEAGERWQITAARLIEATAVEWPADGRAYASRLSAMLLSDASRPASVPAGAAVDQAIEPHDLVIAVREGVEGLFYATSPQRPGLLVAEHTQVDALLAVPGALAELAAAEAIDPTSVPGG